MDENWIINNTNLFGLPKVINLSLSTIQYEIFRQVKDKDLNSISDYLEVNIEINKKINLTKSLTIEGILKEHLGFDLPSVGSVNATVSNILGYLQLTLLKEYYKECHKNILTFSKYEEQYTKLLEDFVGLNIDTDELDFIKDELKICDELVTELKKPIYNEWSILNTVTDSPCDFKKNLTNSIDKRQKYLQKKILNVVTIPISKGVLVKTSESNRKKRLVFENELLTIPFPFHELVVQNEYVGNELFNYFLSTSLIPSKFLFLRDYFDENEIKSGIREAREKLPDATGTKNVAASFVPQTDLEKKHRRITNEFYSLIAKNQLDQKYYCHSLSETEIHKSLRHIVESFNDFDKLVLTNSQYNAKDYAEVFAKGIITKLEKLQFPKLTKAILNDFVEKSESVEIESASFVFSNEHEFAKKFGVTSDEARNKYRKLKMYVDNYLNDYLGKTIKKKSFNVDDFKFSPDVILKSKEEFEAFLNQRYGDKYESDQLNEIMEKYHGENALVIRQEAQKKVDAKAYINSLYSYDLFKKSMEDENHNSYYRTLQTDWEQSRKKYINENNLEEVDGDSLFLFNTYLGNIFSIYRHAYKYHEADSIKDLNLIPLKKAKFDCLINEQTDHFVAHLKSEKVKGNYKMLLNRKDYVLGLFGSLEKFLANASINFDKSPFKEIFDRSKAKIENAISFDEVKFLAGQKNSSNLSSGANNGQTNENDLPNGLQTPYPSIFKDIQSYQLFEKLHEQYKSNTRIFVANYSFIFYAMQNDGYIICKGTDFISFLSENFQIEIDRIDARQSGSNQRISFYNATKSAIIAQK